MIRLARRRFHRKMVLFAVATAAATNAIVDDLAEGPFLTENTSAMSRMMIGMDVSHGVMSMLTSSPR